MPSLTVTISPENFLRIVAALKRRLGLEGGNEVDKELLIQDLKRYYTKMVFRDERILAEENVASDSDIVTVE